MRYKRIFINEALGDGSRINLDRETSHYLANVLRCRQGEKLEVFNGAGGSYLAEIVHAGKKETVIRVDGFCPETPAAGIPVTLALGISKTRHMDYAIQKAVELGVNSIVPLLTQYGTVRPDAARAEKKQQHWQKIIIHACEQCGRTQFPELAPPLQLSDWLEQDVKGRKILCSTHSDIFLRPDEPAPSRCTLLVGPEGGLSGEEERQAVAAGYTLVTMGKRILRTETAVTAALTIVQVYWGDMRE